MFPHWRWLIQFSAFLSDNGDGDQNSTDSEVFLDTANLAVVTNTRLQLDSFALDPIATHMQVFCKCRSGTALTTSTKFQ